MHIFRSTTNTEISENIKSEHSPSSKSVNYFSIMNIDNYHSITLTIFKLRFGKSQGVWNPGSSDWGPGGHKIKDEDWAFQTVIFHWNRPNRAFSGPF